MLRMCGRQDWAAVMDMWQDSPMGENVLVLSRREAPLVVMEDILSRGQTYLWVERGSGALLGFLAMLGDDVAALHVRDDCEEQGIERILLLEAMKTRDVMRVQEWESNLRQVRTYVKSCFHIENIEKDLDRFESVFTLAWRRYGKPNK